MATSSTADRKEYTARALRVPRPLHPTRPFRSVGRDPTKLGSRNMRLYGTLVLSLAAGALIVAPTPALAATHVVHPGESIQAAVDAASPGDTVRVQPGTYHEAVLVQ